MGEKLISFRGKPLGEMSKDELIEVIQFVADETEMVRKEAQRQRCFLSRLRRAS